jgi:hypothetical protein
MRRNPFLVGHKLLAFLKNGLVNPIMTPDGKRPPKFLSISNAKASSTNREKLGLLPMLAENWGQHSYRGKRCLHRNLSDVGRGRTLRRQPEERRSSSSFLLAQYGMRRTAHC